MSNFENACFKACDDWVNEIECNIEPDYSKEHIKRIRDISKGKGNSRFGGKKLRILLVAAIILLLNVTAFAAVQSKQLKLTEGMFGNDLRLDDPIYDKSVDDIEYGYIPEGFKEVDKDYSFSGNDDVCPCIRLEFSNGKQRFELSKMAENTAIVLYPNEEQRIRRYEYNGISYLYIEATEDPGFNYPLLYWDNDGYLFSLVAYEKGQTFEEMVKIARDVK